MNNLKNMYDLIIIGGGASGLTAGAVAKKRGKNVLILEANERVGKKILATGNGKCNLTNAHIDICKYNTELVAPFLKQQFKVCKFFDMIGLKTKLIDDKYYPYSETATTVLNLLRDNNAHMLTNCKAEELIKKEGIFEINGRYKAEKVAICTGSNASFGITSHMLLEKFGHSITFLRPALVPIITDTKFIKKLNGVRAKVAVSLMDDNNKVLITENGEILFKSNGVSGIVVFMISSYMARQEGNYQMSIDFAPDLSGNELSSFVENYSIYGMLHRAIADSICAQAIDRKVDLCSVIKDFRLRDLKLGNIRNAQVVCGGVPLSEFDDNLQSSFCKNLYACGEVLDVDGNCGGYNLNWAFLSGIVVGESV